MQWELMEKEGQAEIAIRSNGQAASFVFVIALEQPFQTGGQSFRPAQFNACHLQEQRILISGEQPGRCRSLLFFGNNEDLSVYSSCCQKLQTFLSAEQPLLPAPAFMSLDMQGLVKSLLSFKGEEAFAAMYYQSILQQWLTLCCIQLNLLTDQPAYPASALAAAMEAKRIIVADFETMHTVEQLAKRTGITEAGLQAVFKYLYGTTVAQFSRQARLEEAHRILSTTTYPLRVVCLMVGYPDASNFSVAFKNQYGYWPGRIQQQQHSPR